MLESAETELQSPAIATTLPGATTIRRKRGPSLSRRSGQQGNVVQKSQPWDSVALAYGRFWVDTPGVERQRKTIVNYSQVVKLVLASALSVEGEQLYPRKWNHDFIGMPVVLVTEQRRPTLTSEQVAAILARAESPYRVLFALLAGTGLRIGEALALKASDFSSDFRSLEVRRSMWRGREQ